MAKLRQYSELTDREIQVILERERQSKNFNTGSVGDIEDPGARTVRLVRTTTSAENPTYPVSPHRKFVVEFGDYIFDDTVIDDEDLTFEPYTPELKRIAYHADGWLPQNTVCLATLHQGEWHLQRFGLDCDIIRFVVLTQDPGTRSVLAQVTAVPNGCDVEELPEVDGSVVGGIFIGHIEICDPIGCFFTEPDPELIGRHGWAKYMLPVEPNVCQPDQNYLVPMWEVFSLCPAPPPCDV